MDERLKRQLDFLIEIDRMKSVLRQTLLADGSRRENDAEHSWHMAMMAMVLREYAGGEIDLLRVLKMALVHDVIEVYAGDTFAYDERGNESKEAREREAADRLFGILPGDQNSGLRALWEEFDAMLTDDSRYAAAIDRLQPFINNYLTEGHTWKHANVTSGEVYKRMDIIRVAAPALWPFVVDTIDASVEKGYLIR